MGVDRSKPTEAPVTVRVCPIHLQIPTFPFNNCWCGATPVEYVRADRDTGEIDRLLAAKVAVTQEASMALVRLKALAEWARDYATAHDFAEYPRALIDAEEWLLGKQWLTEELSGSGDNNAAR